MVGRLQQCSDLVAADAAYHHACHVRFLKCHGSFLQSASAGRPEDTRRTLSLTMPCEWMESDMDWQYATLGELQSKTIDISESDKVYLTKRLKQN